MEKIIVITKRGDSIVFFDFSFNNFNYIFMLIDNKSEIKNI